MTREEAIANLNMISVAFVEPVTKEQRKLIDDTFEMAIQALSQEPCEDAIDREYLFKVLDDFCGHDRTATITLDTLADLVYDMPTVTQKSGKWIDIPFSHYFKCSECDKYQISATNYCPNCGAKMVEPQESEDKE